MRIFDLERRIKIKQENEIDVFREKAEYYKTNNVFPVKLFGKSIKNIYKNINLQLILSYACNSNCAFCVENDIKNGSEISTKKYTSLLDSILKQYHNQNIFPSVSITGGEPLIKIDRLKEILKTVKENNVERYNVNTNGYFIPKHLDFLKSSKVPAINVSRHDSSYQELKRIFRSNQVITDDELTKANNQLENLTLQAVLVNSHLDSVEKIKEYLENYTLKGFKQFSFRGLSILDEEKSYPKEIKFTKENFVDIFQILNDVCKDKDFQFVQQKVGDYYLYEFWKFKGAFVRFTYSNFSWLREQEIKERKNGEIFSRATIIYPEGRVTSSWCDDISEIYHI